ncbi:phage tail assembly chaperone family protein, TAC [Acinetobacter baumannii]|uniref:phage tail assembly chaperone family protein, TAC n=1 Tax=Acinetobacter baumannii TaxID=470 RepID=UPI002542E343|nr:phage tail assembly chaperone family protein, TAC [Acinetobacter baumannii]WIH75522.1 phage tail assembly chaperone family protein, TAC [Acinetobacter baumannii]
MAKKEVAKTEQKTKLNFAEICSGVLVSTIRDVTVEFLHAGKKESTDIRIKQLPFIVTEPLYKRLNKGEDVAAEWIALALVNEKGDNFLTKDQVDKHFTQSLTGAVFQYVIGADEPEKDEEGKSE